MLFSCTNTKELLSKGLVPLGDLNIDIDANIIVQCLKTHSVLIYDMTTGSFQVKKPFLKYRLPDENALQVWVITDDSYTDNLENDTFTYFKYGSG